MCSENHMASASMVVAGVPPLVAVCLLGGLGGLLGGGVSSMVSSASSVVSSAFSSSTGGRLLLGVAVSPLVWWPRKKQIKH